MDAVGPIYKIVIVNTYVASKSINIEMLRFEKLDFYVNKFLWVNLIKI